MICCFFTFFLQFSAIHSRGSSHGPSRIIRRAYVEPYYVKMMNDAYTLWSDVEKESGTTVYTYACNMFIIPIFLSVYIFTVIYTCMYPCRRTGIIVFGPSDRREVQSVAKSLEMNNVPHEVFSGRDANLRYPHQLRLPDDYICVYEDGGGFLNAQKAVMAFQVYICG